MLVLLFFRLTVNFTATVSQLIVNLQLVSQHIEVKSQSYPSCGHEVMRRGYKLYLVVHSRTQLDAKNCKIEMVFCVLNAFFHK